MIRLASALVLTILLFAGSAFAQTATSKTTPMPAPAATAPATTPPAAMKPVNINTATAAELDALPQIGAKRAEKIIKGRPYASADELVSKKVLSQGVFDKIKDKIVVR